MKQCLFLISILSLVCGCSAQHIEIPITVKVIDEKRELCADVKVGVGFTQNRMNDPSINYSGKTDTNGVFEITESGSGTAGISVSKEGYYNWYQRYFFYPHASKGKGVKKGSVLGTK